MRATLKILTEGRRAKNTLKGINVGMYLSWDKVASQIKVMLLLQRRRQFPIFPDATNRRVSPGRSCGVFARVQGPRISTRRRAGRGEPDKSWQIFRGGKVPSPAPPPLPQMPPCLALPSLPAAALMKISCQSVALIWSTRLHPRPADLYGGGCGGGSRANMCQFEISAPGDKTITSSEAPWNDTAQSLESSRKGEARSPRDTMVSVCPSLRKKRKKKRTGNWEHWVAWAR